MFINKTLLSLSLLTLIGSLSVTAQAAQQCPAANKIQRNCQKNSCSYTAEGGWSGNNKITDGTPKAFRWVILTQKEDDSTTVDYCAYFTDVAIKNLEFNKRNKNEQWQEMKINAQAALKKINLKLLKKETIISQKEESLKLLNELQTSILNEVSINDYITTYKYIFDSVDGAIKAVEKIDDSMDAHNILNIQRALSTINNIILSAKKIPDFRLKLLNNKGMSRLVSFEKNKHWSSSRYVCKDNPALCTFSFQD